MQKILKIVALLDKVSLMSARVSMVALWALAILVWASVYLYESPIGAFVALVILAAYQSYKQQGKLEQAMVFIYPTIPFIFLYL